MFNVVGLAIPSTFVQKKKFLVLLDRDGTLIDDIPYLGDTAMVNFIPNVIEVLKKLNNLCCFVIVSNQSGIERKLVTENAVLSVFEIIKSKLLSDNIDIIGYVFCPHESSSNCYCRKPSPYMLNYVRKEMNFSVENTIYIGNNDSDLYAGHGAGIMTLICDKNYSNPDYPNNLPLGWDEIYEFLSAYLENIGKINSLGI
jgi:D-glycero-D-manno-heptose 1,7-bisphosphate phosphatase